MESDSKDSSFRLTNENIHRYGRQLILPQVGMQAQTKICQARVLVIGAGGLGAPVALKSGLLGLLGL